MRVHLFDSSSEALFSISSLILEDQNEDTQKQSFSLADVNQRGKDLCILVKGISDRNGAEQLRGRKIFVNKIDLPRTDENEFYDFDLIGMDVRTIEDKGFGTVIGVEHPPANDVIIIELVEEQGFVDIPLVDGIVVDVNPETSVITIDLPSGFPVRDQK